jgi:hypothetical protein
MIQELYSNPKQQIFLYHTHPLKFFHAGRGTGKSHGIAWSVLEKVNHLPRSKGMMTCKTITQFLNKTFPIIKSVWQSMGMVEDEHFVAFKKRPEHWPAPFVEPEDYKHIIWFCNGTCAEVVASTQYDSARGGSYDWIEADEIGFFPEEFYDDVILPSNRGNNDKYFISLREFAEATGRELAYLKSMHGSNVNSIIPHPLHHQVCLYTSPPRKTEHMWIYKFQSLADTDHQNFFWLEANALDNIEAFGRKNFEMIKKQMNKRSFEAEMLGTRLMEAERLFYFAYTDSVHRYQPNKTYVTINEQLFFNADTPIIDSYKALHLSFDFSGWFNCMLIAQPATISQTPYEYLHDSLFTKEEGNIDQLIDKFCDKYRHHNYKFALVYGEPRGHDRTPQGKTLYEAISARLRKHGWDCEIITPKKKKTESHSERHRTMNEILAETNPHYPRIRFNGMTCSNVIQAIKFTEVKDDFQKNKSQEKNRKFPQEHAPHFTDALDYYIFQKHSYRFTKIPTGTLEARVV